MRTRMSLPFLFVVVAAVVGGANVAQSEAQGFSFNPCGRGTNGQRFVLFDSGTTVCDNTSGVMWERTPLYALRTFHGAKRTVPRRVQAGSFLTSRTSSRWLTMEICILRSRSRPGIRSPSSIPATQPTGVIASEYWTRTPLAGSPDGVWSFVMDFGRTFAASISGTSGDFVWCVK